MVRKITKEERDIAVYAWEEVVKGVLKNRSFTEHVSWFLSEVEHLLGADWEHDELACDVCGGDCKQCPIVGVIGNCHKVHSAWSDLVNKWDVEGAKRFVKAYGMLEVEAEEEKKEEK